MGCCSVKAIQVLLAGEYASAKIRLIHPFIFFLAVYNEEGILTFGR
jgi:hypothetical protein